MKSLKSLLAVLLCVLATATASGKRIVMLAYYGTTNDKARQATIDVTTRMVTDSLGGTEVCEVFTSPWVIHALDARGIHKPFIDEALDSLIKQGYDTIVVGNCQMLDGVMTRDIERCVDARADDATIKLTNPLLYDSDDCKWLASVLTSRVGTDGRQVVFVGHGTDDSSNGMYALFDYVLKHSGKTNYHVGTIESYPGIAEVEGELREAGAKDVTLYPLLYMAGNHALKDIDGKWHDALTADGFNVEVVHEGLFEVPAVRRRILDNVRKALKE